MSTPPIILNMDKNLGVREVNEKARMLLNKNKDFINGYIFINCPNVSDLFAVGERKIRESTIKEWSLFFKEYVAPNFKKYD